MSKWAIPAAVAAGAAVLLLSSKAAASVGSGSGSGSGSGGGSTSTGAIVPGGPKWSAYSAAQQQLIAMIIAEAQRQGVAIELALATAEVESNFTNVKAVNGASYGPMQVHTSHLAAGETVSDLQNPSFSIARGVQILKRYLTKAGGDTVTARIFYFCGPAYTDSSCKPATRETVKARWKTATTKWKVKPYY